MLYGPPDTGKTSWAYRNYPGLYAMPCPQKSAYWIGDDYEDEETLLFDDYGNHPDEVLPWTILLQLTDGRSINYPCKGGFTCLNKVRRVIFTSNRDPQLWPRVQLWEAFRRRITHLFEFTGPQTRTIKKAPEGYFAQLEALQEEAEIRDESSTEIGIPSPGQPGDIPSVEDLMRILTSDEEL